MKLFIVDAFSQTAFGGNQAGVVLLDNGSGFPSDETMIKIAAELRYSETAFVQQISDNEFTTRYFTPCSEVDLCGHATIAAFSVLKQEGIIKDGTEYINRTKAGDLTVKSAEGVLMQMAQPQLIEKELDKELLYRIMGTTPHPHINPAIVSTGLPDILLPVSTKEELDNLAPDMAALSELSRQMEVVGVHAFAISQQNYTAHVRNFAPLYGIEEESATGTANGALTYFLYTIGVAEINKQCSYLQGESMGRPSVISSFITEEKNIYVGGNGYIIAKGELYI